MNEFSGVSRGSGIGHENRHCNTAFKKQDVPAPRLSNPQREVMMHDNNDTSAGARAMHGFGAEVWYKIVS